MTDDPNNRQVGGSHYSRTVGPQHWDLMALADAGYFAGQVTKYTERHSRKNGREDLEKALHFAEKWQSVGRKKPSGFSFVPGRSGSEYRALSEAIRDYAVDAELTAIQQRIFEYCLLEVADLEEVVRLCRVHLHREYGAPVIKELAAPIPAVAFGELHAPGTPEDGGHHAVLAQAVEDAILAEEALSTDTGAMSQQDVRDALAGVTEFRHVDGVDQDQTGPVTRGKRRRGEE